MYRSELMGSKDLQLLYIVMNQRGYMNMFSLKKVSKYHLEPLFYI